MSDVLTLAALGIERRTVALAFFRDLHLEDMLLRQLSSELGKSTGSVTELLNQSVERHRIGFVALLQPNDSTGERVRELYEAAINALRAASIPLIEVREQELLDSFGHPPLSRREHLRKAGRNIWPSLNDARATHSAVDAAALGLHVQVERLFSIHSEQP